MSQKEKAYIFVGKNIDRRLPLLSVGLPSGLGDKGREGKPVVILVLLQIRISDQQEMVEKGSRFRGGDAFPYLRTSRKENTGR